MTAIKDLETGFGKIEYKGYVFSPLRHVKVKTTLVYDDADRAMIAVKYNLEVVAITLPVQQK